MPAVVSQSSSFVFVFVLGDTSASRLQQRMQHTLVPHYRIAPPSEVSFWPTIYRQKSAPSMADFYL